MRIVLDTNVPVSAVIAAGPPQRLLSAALAGEFELCTSEVLLAELLDVLSRAKFAARLELAGLTPQGLVDDLRRQSVVVSPMETPSIVLHDPDEIMSLLPRSRAAPTSSFRATGVTCCYFSAIRAFRVSMRVRRSIGFTDVDMAPEARLGRCGR